MNEEDISLFFGIRGYFSFRRIFLILSAGINIPKIGVYVRSCQYNECPGVPLLYQIERFQHVRVAVQTVEVRCSGALRLGYPYQFVLSEIYTGIWNSLSFKIFNFQTTP